MPVRPYKSYLLRLWRMQGDQELVLKAYLENSQTGERQGFSKLQALFDFLKERRDQPDFNPSEEENDEP